MSKPRIRRCGTGPWWYWECKGDGVFATGITPRLAWLNWNRRMTRTTA